MRIIALDTALGACSAAAFAEGRIVARRYLDMNRGHAEVLMGLLDEVEDEAGFGALSCDRLAVTIGPGTFTGLRVGLAAARGLALASAKPLAGITTLHAIAAGADALKSAETIAVVLDARRGDVYLGLYRNDEFRTPFGSPRVLPVEEARKVVAEEAGKAPLTLIGTGAALMTNGQSHLDVPLASGLVQPDAGHVARLAARIDDVAAWPPEPLYLRAPDAKLPSRNPLE